MRIETLRWDGVDEVAVENGAGLREMGPGVGSEGVQDPPESV